ncbi:hypothetical protein [Actinomadura oligospora]|uniref:hypothetical protein n=1 Tax=Actinomadura oligospora TaxID=111804 RepID=UPI00047A76A4|nr:hypothetical protein [Actinomadura oligospora]
MAKPAWSSLRLALLALVSLLVVGCLTQAGKSIASVSAATNPVNASANASARSVGAPARSIDTDARSFGAPARSGDAPARSVGAATQSVGADVQVCRFDDAVRVDAVQRASARPDGSGGAAGQGHCTKQAVAENSSIAPAASSMQVATVLSPAEGDSSLESAGQAYGCAPSAPPDVGRLCVLRI